MTTETWYLWLDESRSPALNMAIDELLLENSAEYGKPIIRIYDWDRPSITIGYVQNYDAAPQENYTIVRRPTGGGVVFHDVDLTYTAVIPADHPIHQLDRLESYHVFHRAILRMLAEFGLEGNLAPSESGPVDRATMQCFTTPTRYDVVAAGKKYAGAAQRRTRNGILHQGSIMTTAAGGDEQKLQNGLVSALEEEFSIKFVPFTPDDGLMSRATNLADEKYATDAWNIDRKYQRAKV